MWEIIASILGGGATGLIGSGVTAFSNYKQKKLDVEHEEKMLKLTSECSIAEIEANIKVTETEVAGDIAEKELDVFMESQKSGSLALFKESYMKSLSGGGRIAKFFAALIAFGMGCMDIFRASIRPGLTTYLIILTTFLTVRCWNILGTLSPTPGNVLMATDAFKILQDIILTLLYLTTTAVSWWFADRSAAKFLEKRLNKY